ncbi:hypothetical protein A0J61_02006 [Choanephora cucurbitarum]|uniref:Membrane anchor Opy2 N-terminal domain-containing protein n=1 Tax=Choanephora cucurbitarum TaxID=101091 RepID=A0A1C7NLF3_9FUNG|nr:hypothetical protein A0J61_02006 [Choanephora cucurbitarum]
MNIYTHFKQEFQSEMSTIMFARNTIHIDTLEARINNDDRTGSCMPPTHCEAECSPGCSDNYVCVLSIMADCGVCPLSKCLSRTSLGFPLLPTSSQKGVSTPTSQNKDTESSDDLGSIIGSVVGAFVGMGLIAAAVAYLYLKKSESKKKQLPFAFSTAISPQSPPPNDCVPPQTTLSIYTASKLETDKEPEDSNLQALPSSCSSRFMGFPHSPRSTQVKQRSSINITYNLASTAKNTDTSMQILEANHLSRNSLHPNLPTTAAHTISGEPSYHSDVLYGSSHHVPQKPVYSNSGDQSSLTTMDTYARQRRSYESQAEGVQTTRFSPVSAETRQNHDDSMRTELPSPDVYNQKSNSVIREMIMESYTTDNYNTHHFPAIPHNKPSMI